jgi:hypothetical protein
LIQPKYTEVSLAAYRGLYGDTVKSAWIRCRHAYDADLSVENILFSQNKFVDVATFLSVSAVRPLQKLFLPQRGASQ